jgi:hypothetical protein
MKRGGPLKRTKPLRAHTKIRLAGRSETADTKREIQRLLREIVILRDGGCILRHVTIYGVPGCNGYTNSGKLILQADHLVTRANAATYADSRLVVCVCVGHHGWKSVGGNARKKLYDEVVRSLLTPERVELWDACERDQWRPHRTGVYDWKLAEVALTAELVVLKAASPAAA